MPCYKYHGNDVDSSNSATSGTVIVAMGEEFV